MEDLYVQLREVLKDRGLFETKSGVELELLKRIFTEEQARIYVGIEDKVQTLEEIAKGLNQDIEELKPAIEEMWRKGLVLTIPLTHLKESDPKLYRPNHWLPSIWEHSVFYQDRETAELGEKYWNSDEIKMEESFLRPVPINQSLDSTRMVAPYDDIKKILAQAEKICVGPCACEVFQQNLGREIDQPLEKCIFLDFVADMVVNMGDSKYISLEQAYDILDQCAEAGFVHQSGDTTKPGAICNCGRHCGALGHLKKLDKPAEMVTSNYYAVIDADLCAGCEICIDRCIMEAININSQGVAEVDLDRCIGCGVCVIKCDTGALTLMEKPESKHHTPSDKNPFAPKASTG